MHIRHPTTSYATKTIVAIAMCHCLADCYVGIWPIFMGASMYFQQLLNPQPADPVQAKIFLFMPLFFTFLLGSFPAGLVIYWTWNNILSVTQQYLIMKRMGVPIRPK